jgi:uncharacterized membrane protein YtjA (UPF0391 family)
VIIKLTYQKGDNMNWLMWAVIFFILAIVAGAFGFGVIAGTSYAIAKVFAVVFVVLLVVSIILHIVRRM